MSTERNDIRFFSSNRMGWTRVCVILWLGCLVPSYLDYDTIVTRRVGWILEVAVWLIPPILVTWLVLNFQRDIKKNKSISEQRIGGKDV